MTNRTIPLYRNDGSTEDFELVSMTFELQPNGVAIVSFATPKTYHALTAQMRHELLIVIEHINRCDAVKVVVWTGEGDKAFCSGASLKGGSDVTFSGDAKKEYAARELGPAMKTDNALLRETRAFWDCKKVIIGAINGMAVGGGANIALFYFDIVYASENAKFMYPFADIGFTAELSSSLMLPFQAGLQRAKELIFSCDWFSAQQAERYNLVNSVHKPEVSGSDAGKETGPACACPNRPFLLTCFFILYLCRSS